MLDFSSLADGHTSFLMTKPSQAQLGACRRAYKYSTQKDFFYLLNCRGWWPGNRAGLQSVGGWRKLHQCLQLYQKQLCAESGGAVWGAACWVVLYLGLEG